MAEIFNVTLTNNTGYDLPSIVMWFYAGPPVVGGGNTVVSAAPLASEGVLNGTAYAVVVMENCFTLGLQFPGSTDVYLMALDKNPYAPFSVAAGAALSVMVTQTSIVLESGTNQLAVPLVLSTEFPHNGVANMIAGVVRDQSAGSDIRKS